MVKLLNNKVSPGKINHKNAKKSCQIALFSSKTATERFNSYTVFCFDLQSCVNLRFYKLGCQWLTALLTPTDTRLKDPSKRQNKMFQKVL